MGRLLVICLGMLFALTVSAQDNASQLVSPSANGYLDTLIAYGPELVAYQSPLHEDNLHSVLATISEVVFYLYPDPRTIDFQKQLQAYTALDIGRTDYVQRNVWVQRMIEAWLYQNDVDLSAVNELQFEDFYITVIPRDFNGDGTNEYLLDVIKGALVDRQRCIEAAEVVDYLVVEQSQTGYRFVDTGLPWIGIPEYARYSPNSGGMIEMFFNDINADGLPEWIVLDGGNIFGAPLQGYMNFGELFVLGWRDGGLDFLSPNYLTRAKYPDAKMLSFESPAALCDSGPYPFGVDWEFTNVDDDAPLEILQHESLTDNWNCNRVETLVFDWDAEADQYFYRETLTTYATDSRDCVQRDAEETTWTGDYAAAVPLYERALTLERIRSAGTVYYLGNSLDNLEIFLQERLAYAYLMTGQSDKAAPLIQGLMGTETIDQAIEDYVTVLSDGLADETTPLELCIATFNVFTEHYPYTRVDYTGDLGELYPPSYQPEHLCDAPAMVKDAMQQTAFPLNRQPVDVLRDNNIGVQQVFETDLNNDGLSEWLIWLDVPGLQAFFAPEGDSYHASYPTIDPFHRSSDFQVWQLPGDAGESIAVVTFDDFDFLGDLPPWNCYSDSFCGIGGGPFLTCPAENDSSVPGRLRLWKLEDAELVPVLNMDTCEQEIKAFPGEGGQETLRITLLNDEFGPGLPPSDIVYVWDANMGQYVNQPEPTPVESPTPYSTPEPRPTYPYSTVDDAFQNGDFTVVLQMTESDSALSGQESLDTILANRYLRALSLEALGRGDEALALYVAIHDDLPEQIWGILAALHFKPVD